MKCAVCLEKNLCQLARSSKAPHVLELRERRAVLWGMHLGTAAIIFACTGMAYFLSQVQLIASVFSLHVQAKLLEYQSFTRLRAVLWQMYLVTAAIINACTGMAYFLSQVQLTCWTLCLPLLVSFQGMLE